MPSIYNLKPGNVLDVVHHRGYFVKAFVQDGILSLSHENASYPAYSWEENAEGYIYLDPGRWHLGWSGEGEGALLVYNDEAPKEVVYVDGLPTIGTPTHLEISRMGMVNRIPTTGGYAVQKWDLPFRVYSFSAEWLGLNGEQAAFLLSRLLDQPTYGKTLQFADLLDTDLNLSGPPNIEVVSQGNGYWDVRIQGVAAVIAYGSS